MNFNYTGQATLFVQKVPTWGPYTAMSNIDVEFVLLNEKVVWSGVPGSGVKVLILGKPSDSIILGDTPPGGSGYAPPSGAILPCSDWVKFALPDNPIPVGDMTYTIEDIAQIAPPLNIVGYTYNSGDSVYDLGTYSRYNYTPQQQIFFDNQMVGDTAKVFIETIFRDDVIVNKEFKIIFDEFD